MLLKYSGISFISGAVNHGFFSGTRSLWTAAIGIVLFVLGAQDQMTQPKAAHSLIAAAKDSGKTITVHTVPVGHHQMTEAPDDTLFALAKFLNR